MKNILVFLFISFFSFNSFAEWKHMYKDKKSDNWYIDFTKVKRINDHVFYQTLVDHSNNKEFPSTITNHQGDCNTLEWKMTHITFFSDNIAKGRLSSEKMNYNFSKVDQNTILGFLLKSVCEN